MDFKVTGVIWTLFFLTVLTSVLANAGCRQCKPGLYSVRQCTETHDTVCSPCSIGTYTDTYNTLSECIPCSKCGEGEFMSLPCTRHSECVCESCASPSNVDNENYLKECFQNDDPIVDKPSDVQIVDNTEELEDGSTFPIQFNEEVYEGSGVAIIEGIDGFTKDDTETIEGSGEIPDTGNETATVPVVILPDDGESEELVTNTTVIQGGTATTKPTISSTHRIGGVSIGAGITLKDDSSQEGKTEVVVTQSPTTPFTDLEQTTTAKRKTTPKAGVIVIDDGVVLATEKTPPYHESDDEQEDDVYDDVEDINIVIPADDPHTGASRRQQAGGSSSGVAVGVVVAVVFVAAVVFFIVGFLVSRYWSRRQERTFNVLDAERRNGSTVTGGTIEYKDPERHVTNRKGIYDEIPADKQNGTGIGADQKPYTATAADNVYSQPVKRPPPKDDDTDQTKENPIMSDPETHAEPTSNHTDFIEWAGRQFSINSSTGSLIMSVQEELKERQEERKERPVGVQEELKERPISNIQYIDETDSDNETDTLLKSVPTNDTSNQSGETAPKSPQSPAKREVEAAPKSPQSPAKREVEAVDGGSDGVNDAGEHATESSPMIQKQSEKKES